MATTTPSYRKRRRTLTRTEGRPVVRISVWAPANGSRRGINNLLDELRRDGWHIDSCDPRVLEGPQYGMLIVARRVARPAYRTIPRKERRPLPLRIPAPPPTDGLVPSAAETSDARRTLRPIQTTVSRRRSDPLYPNYPK